MKKILITGGLGLVGANYAKFCLDRDDDVYILDNYSHGQASYRNAEWLLSGDKIPVIRKGNIANYMDLAALLGASHGLDAVVHAVSCSSAEPMKDFEAQTVGMFNLLEILRCESPATRVVNLASRRIYDTGKWPVQREGRRCRWVSRRVGPAETFPLDVDAHDLFTAGQISGIYYSRAFADLYDLPIVTLVLSAVYGRHHYGRTASHGGVSWLAIAGELGLPVKVCGDGSATSDMLHVSDVVTAVDRVLDIASVARGSLFNVGGGPSNTVALRELIEMVEDLERRKLHVTYEDAGSGDQTYVTNYEKMLSLGWTPSRGLLDGLSDLVEWVRVEKPILRTLYSVR